MSHMRGRTIPMSLPRRWIGDFLHFAQKTPSVVVQRQMDLGPLVRARSAAGNSIRWCTLFIKAYALVGRDFPQLRRTYRAWPWARFYEHPQSVASLAIERDYLGEKAVFFAQFRDLEARSLVSLDEAIGRAKEAPVETNGAFRRLLRISRLPWPLRRLAWRLGLHLSGRQRAKHMGTFGVSSYASLGAESFSNLTLLTTSLSYGIIRASEPTPVRISYDHRVMDGATVARALAALDRILTHDIVAELESLPVSRAA